VFAPIGTNGAFGSFLTLLLASVELSRAAIV
jgi:hypothetical protein